MNPAKVLLSALLVVGLARLTVEAQERRRRRLPEGVETLRDIEYGKGGKTSLLLDLYRPADRGEDPLPAVVWIHGGGWRGGGKANGENAAYLAAHGYVAVSIDYRLSGVAPFPAAVEDCKCAVRWLRAHAREYGVDPDRIGVWGGSAGGHLALMVGLADAGAGLEGNGGWKDVSSRVAAVCNWFGPADMTVLTGKQSPLSDSPVTQFLGGAPEEIPELYALASPVTHASKDDPPTLLVHGDRDAMVPLSQSEAMLARLEEVGVERELLVVKNAAHGFKPSGGEPEPDHDGILDRCRAFFDEHLRGDAERVPREK